VAARSAAFLISEVCDGQVVLRPRGTQIPETLDTLVIGVCGIFMLLGRAVAFGKTDSPRRRSGGKQRSFSRFRGIKMTALGDWRLREGDGYI
jgi:hypothetical protein